MTQKKERLSAESWLMAGFRALARSGPQALKAEALARDLGTTKGSFYWHFKDVPSFQAQMLELWEKRAVDEITQSLDQERDPVRRLYALGEISTSEGAEHGGHAAEPAIRAWAQGNHTVADVVTRVDQKRLDYLAGILADLELTNPDFARLIYGAYIGMGTLSAKDGADNKDAMSTLLAALLALRDA
ncbi:transcriptional regulator, TetR family [Aliiroseovarius halocynthiae]|uniref:TetR/AcrR family transcriptional regulator n=1 Tax=Aliiroseovarius halocynthiae TaxID=985055 RepID=A0A545SN03_9RHOB|nr:TetR/AcrR family transcriptional regulator [Aliiroseovarius halocynthiae]TQV66349.1 TetR/AcrR family transcriptional regulator [Aliiroseovarius halocynthiae]SMR83322.1 transcriptional regulator, TetR family [Aliiroseovarius halocynthiae]